MPQHLHGPLGVQDQCFTLAIGLPFCPCFFVCENEEQNSALLGNRGAQSAVTELQGHPKRSHCGVH